MSSNRALDDNMKAPAVENVQRSRGNGFNIFYPLPRAAVFSLVSKARREPP